MKRLFSSICIIIGVLSLFFTGYMVWQRNSPARLSFALQSYPKKSTTQVSRLPKRITIKKIDIDLPVIPAVVTERNWEATTEGVSYLSSSVVPGEVGNSILYGHNWRNLLGNLTYAKPGQDIIVEYDDNSKAVFTIEYTTVVSPNQTYILDAADDKRITLYTCTGFLDSRRFVVVAILHS